MANTKRGRDPTRYAVAYTSKKKQRVSVHESDDDESGYNSIVCVKEEVNMALGMSDMVYILRQRVQQDDTYLEEAHEEP